MAPEAAVAAAAHRKARAEAAARSASHHPASHAATHPAGHEARLVVTELRWTGVGPAHAGLPRFDPRLAPHRLFLMMLDNLLRMMVDNPARPAVALQVPRRLHAAGRVAE